MITEVWVSHLLTLQWSKTQEILLRQDVGKFTFLKKCTTHSLQEKPNKESMRILKIRNLQNQLMNINVQSKKWQKLPIFFNKHIDGKESVDTILYHHTEVFIVHSYVIKSRSDFWQKLLTSAPNCRTDRVYHFGNLSRILNKYCLCAMVVSSPHAKMSR